MDGGGAVGGGEAGLGRLVEEVGYTRACGARANGAFDDFGAACACDDCDGGAGDATHGCWFLVLRGSVLVYLGILWSVEKGLDNGLNGVAVLMGVVYGWLFGDK